MFDVGFSELLLLAIVALVVLGPEKLPHAARMAGAWIGRIRRTILSVQAEIENEVAASEMRARIQAELERAKAALPDVSLEENRIAPPRLATDKNPGGAADPDTVPHTAATAPESGATLSSPASAAPARDAATPATPSASEPARTP